VHDETTVDDALQVEQESAGESVPGRRPLDVPVRLVLYSSDEVPDDLDARFLNRSTSTMRRHQNFVKQ
jgi:hypothetical protein